MVKGADKKKKKGKEEKEKEKEKDKEKLTKGKSSDLVEEALSEAEPVHSEGNLMCRMVAEHQDETTPDMSESSERHGQPMEISAVYYEEPILTKLIIESYEGETIRGLYEGVGTAHFQGGHVYQGMFSEGLMHGRGTYTWKDGTKYEGDFSTNTPTGHGTYTWPDGSTYVGEVVNGIRHGEGIFTSPDQLISYTGDWHQAKRHGKGTVYFNQEGSSWYQGDWVNNVREGWGTRRYKSGNVYEGEWKGFQRHGEGTMSWISTNEEYTGQWQNGLQHGFGTHTWFLKRVPGSQYPQRNQYVGEFVMGARQGQGKFFYANGAVYSGEWVANKKHGLGTFMLKNGRTFEGKFLEDHMVEFPELSITGMKTPDLGTMQTKLLLETGKFTTLEETHSPFDTLLLEKFLSYIIILAYHIYHKTHEGPASLLATCFSKVVTNNIIPYACEVNGNLFKENQCIVIALGYITKCWEVYRIHCIQTRRPPNTYIMTMRHFIWMLKDLNLFSKDLTATQVVQILSEDNPAVSDGTCNNMNVEMVFLEFLEALLMCAAVYVTKRLLENSEASSRTSIEVNVIHIASDISLQMTQAPSEQIVTRESSIAEPNGQSAKPITKKRGESTRKKGKASTGSVEKSSKSSAHHANHGKAGTNSAKNAPKDEEQSQRIAQSAPSMESNKKQSEVPLSGIEKNPSENIPEEKAPSEKTPLENIPEEKSPIKSGAELELWLSQVYFFFVKRLFPAHDHAEVLKVEAKRDIVRQNELAHQAMIKAATRARLKEEATKLEQEDADLLLIVQSPGEQSEDNDKPTYPVQKTPTEVAHLVPSRKGSGNKKKKKSL
ncbi:radial spoke head 10 homolog B isoform X2 [Chiloscyllium plagiosum]|uniref:radial spoke head 10 homolog B isoform X2 n=1 Tax=Chiloscyllium plagiosum TaxID=36176 RepID=UPI001CB80B5E|nr:radial spoke head 10 homolog B isoform X2 [Chiloscyllium plagiosum]